MYFNMLGVIVVLDEIQAAILNVKLKHLDEDIQIRKNIAKYYINHIRNSKNNFTNCF